MRIGIVTLPLHNNYGGILQAYALQKVLQDMGHEATVIDRPRLKKLNPISKIWVYGGRIFRKHVLGKQLVIKKEKEHNDVVNALHINTYPFILKHIRRFEANIRYSNIKKRDYDAFVVGSDQVWRPAYFKRNIISQAYLAFAEGWDVKRISYAASFGGDNWEYTPVQTAECGRLLKLFNAVSVREDSAMGLCKSHFGVKAQHVLDPTMLLEAKDYSSLFKMEETPKSDGTLMCYILDSNDEKERIVSHIEKRFNLVAFSINSKYEIKDAPIEERIQPPVESWLRGFHDAEFVITDSFHACVFSILFEKPFIVYGNKGRGMARFESLLKIFSLESRLVTDHKEAEKAIDSPIDWNKVNTIKKEWQKESLDFLKNNL